MGLLDIEGIKHEATEQQIDYLRMNLDKKDLTGVDQLIQESQNAFRKHSHHLEAVYSVLLEAPNELHMKRIEESVTAYLKNQGVSATWISMAKGALKLKKLIRDHREWYSNGEAMLLLGLESEKAYLASRMTIEGQKKLCEIHRTNGGISVRETRKHLKSYQFDPSSIWKDKSQRTKNQQGATKMGVGLVGPNRAVPCEVLDLVNQLSLIMEGLSDHLESWEKDPRVHSMVDRDLLIRLTKKFCTEWYENPYSIDSIDSVCSF